MSTYNVWIDFTNRVAIERVCPSARFEKFGDGTTNVTLDDGDVDEFVAWCDTNAIDAELV